MTDRHPLPGQHTDRNIALAFGSLVLVLMLVVLLLGSYYSTRLAEENERELEATIVGMLSTSMQRVSFSGKFHARMFVEQMVQSQPRLSYIAIADSDGVIIAHSDSTQNGHTLKHDQANIAKQVLVSKQTSFSHVGDDDAPIRQIAAIFHAGFEDRTPGVIFVGLSLAEAQQKRHAIDLQLTLFATLLALLSVATTFALSRRFGHSIRSMANQLDGILRHSPLFIRIGDRSGEVLAASDTYHEAAHTNPKLFSEEHDAYLRGEEVTHEIQPNPDQVLSVTSFPVEIGSKDEPIQVCTVGVDITTQRRAEEALRDNKERLRITLDSIDDGVIATDGEGRVQHMNPVAETLTGLTRAAALGQSLNAVVSTSPADEDDDDAFDILDGASERTLHDANGVVRRIASSAAPMLDAKGERIGSVLVVRDVTERHHTELQLRHQSRLQSIGQLAGGIAHDFNNMLTGLIGATELLELALSGKDDLGDEVEEYINLILTTASRAGELTEKLLAFSRKGGQRAQLFDAHAMINDTVALLMRSVDKQIEIVTDLHAEETNIKGDLSRIQNALLNLGLNARDAITERGHITITTRSVDFDASSCKAKPFELTPGRFIEVTCRDDGSGMSEEQRAHIFEPYYTTKDGGQGTGLGLASVYGTVTHHHGAIEVYSALGEGSTFKIYFPTTQERPALALNHPAAPRGNARVLLVDDEEFVREVARAILERLGYEVVIARDGVEGVERYKAEHEQIDVVLLDMLMPRMNGRDAFHAIRAINPEAKVIAISGYARNIDIEALVADGLMGYLRKPYTHRELATAVATGLRGVERCS